MVYAVFLPSKESIYRFPSSRDIFCLLVLPFCCHLPVTGMPGRDALRSIVAIYISYMLHIYLRLFCSFFERGAWESAIHIWERRYLCLRERAILVICHSWLPSSFSLRDIRDYIMMLWCYIYTESESAYLLTFYYIVGGYEVYAQEPWESMLFSSSPICVILYFHIFSSYAFAIFYFAYYTFLSLIYFSLMLCRIRWGIVHLLYSFYTVYFIYIYES